jgi:hypothetical protein
MERQESGLEGHQNWQSGVEKKEELGQPGKTS